MTDELISSGFGSGSVSCMEDIETGEQTHTNPLVVCLMDTTDNMNSNIKQVILSMGPSLCERGILDAMVLPWKKMRECDIEGPDWEPLAAEYNKICNGLVNLFAKHLDICVSLRIGPERWNMLHVACCCLSPSDIPTILSTFSAMCLAECGNSLGKSPIHYLVTRDDVDGDTIDTLLELTDRWAWSDREGNTPLHYCAKTCFKKSSRLVREMIYELNHRHQTFMHTNQFPDFGDWGDSMFIDNNEPMENRVDRDGNTLLHTAVLALSSPLSSEEYLTCFPGIVPSYPLDENRNIETLCNEHKRSIMAMRMDNLRRLALRYTQLRNVRNHQGRIPAHFFMENSMSTTQESSGCVRMLTIILTSGTFLEKEAFESILGTLPAPQHPLYPPRPPKEETAKYFNTNPGNTFSMDSMLGDAILSGDEVRTRESLAAWPLVYNSRESSGGNTPLHIIAATGNTNILRVYIEECTQVFSPQLDSSLVLSGMFKRRNLVGETVLHCAIRSGVLKMVKEVLQYEHEILGITPDHASRIENCWTLSHLEYSVFWGHREIYDCLCQFDFQGTSTPE